MTTMVQPSVVAEIAMEASKFGSSIVLRFEDKVVDVKSILGLFVSLTGGHDYELHIHGATVNEVAAAKKRMKEVFEKHGLRVTIVE